MKKITLTVLGLMCGLIGFAQEETTTQPEETVEKNWKTGGLFTVLFNQTAFNADWTGGGESNMAGSLNINYDANYSKEDWTWDNKLIVAYGLTRTKSTDQTVKTDDRLEFNSVLGKKATGNWYYSLFLNFKTQMDSGFDLSTGTKLSHFFSPAYLQVGPGMLWKKSDNLNVNIAPATSRLIFVHKHFTEVGNNPAAIAAFNAAGGFFGVEANESLRYELGASLRGYAKFNLMKNVSMENILSLYSNYLEDPQNVDIDYTMNLAMTINKYLSANIMFQAIYDDNVVTRTGKQGFQIKEVFGLGFNYNF